MHVEVVVVVVITVLAGALRFTRLGAQSYWLDETISVDLVHLPLHPLLLAIRFQEQTPPLYYTVAWVWAKVFGADEFGLRSLSALLGTATVPVSYLAARTLATRRAAALAALLVALSPILVWYSQEARSYALFTFLSALSFLFFARTLAKYSAFDLVAWSLSSAAALTTHYFAGFLILCEALWLIRRVSRRKALAIAFAPLVLLQLALLPLIHSQQAQHGTRLATKPIDVRLRQFGTWYLTGHFRAAAPIVVAALAVLVGVWLLLRRTGGVQRAGGLIALSVGLGAPAVAAVVSATVVDYFVFRNLINIWVPLAIALAIGFTGRRAGWLGVGAAVALCVVFFVSDLAVMTRSSLQRDDWRSVAPIVAGSTHPAAIVVYPRYGTRPLYYYAKPKLRCLGCGPSARYTAAQRHGLRVRDLWFVAVHAPFEGFGHDYTSWLPPDKVRFNVPGGFRETEVIRLQHFELRHFVATSTQRVSVSRLERSVAGPFGVQVLVPSGSRRLLPCC